MRLQEKSRLPTEKIAEKFGSVEKYDYLCTRIQEKVLSFLRNGALDEWLSQRSAKPSTAVRIRQAPQSSPVMAGFFLFVFVLGHFYLLTLHGQFCHQATNPCQTITIRTGIGAMRIYLGAIRELRFKRPPPAIEHLHHRPV